MFDFLKKKLKDSISKLSETIKSKEEEPEITKIEEAVQEEIFEQRKSGKEIEEPEEAHKEVPKDGIVEKIKKRISEKTIGEKDIKDVLWDLRIGMLESDVALDVAEKICEGVKSDIIGKSVKKSEIEGNIKESLRKAILDVFSFEKTDLKEEIKKKQEKPFVILLLGYNGSGKTTTVARLGKLLKDSGMSVVFAAADSWRAAAIEQLEEHGEKLGIKVIKQKYGADPAAIVWDAIAYAKARNIDVVVSDTAGRSHANVNLMDELKKVTRVNKPDKKILVIDSLTGNDAVEQARTFNSAVGIDALILTKADVYDKGGAVLSSAFETKKPILFLGTGQNYDDLKPFDPQEITNRLLE